jgi:hypothetical protein
MCYWDNKREFDAPEIFFLERVLLSEDYANVSLSGLPPERGTKLAYLPDSEECIPAFTSITIGVETSEPAECKIDTERRDNFTTMMDYLSEGSSLIYEHTLTLPSSLVPSKYAAEKENYSIQNGGEYDFFINCKDGNGNTAKYDYQINFCVNDGPDMSEPIIIKSNYPRVGAIDIGYIKFNQTSAPLSVYTNEQATCKWDFQDLSYDKMNYGFDQCSESLTDYLNPKTLEYGCSGTVDGIKSRTTNKYYVRCLDKPLWEEGDEGRRIETKRSYPIWLIGTQPLVIDSISINDKQNGTIIKDSTSPIKVELKVNTLAGSDEGKAKCEYQYNGRYFSFYNNGSFDYFLQNIQQLSLVEGTYNIPVKCYDIGGNDASTLISFTIDIDMESPVLARAYYEEGFLKLITTESAECVYSTFGCTYEFEDGAPIQSSADNLNHFVSWDTTTDMFVKCKDIFGNRPAPNECNIVVRAYEKSN